VFLMRDLRNWLEKNTGRQVPFYFVQGTEYHEGRGAEELESIAARVQGANITSTFTGRHCKEVLDLDVGGVLLNFAHHLGGGSGFTRSGSLDAESLCCQITSSKGQAVSADLIVRSHLHYFMHVEHSNRHAFLCPCWQLQTRFARHRSAYKLMPDIGALIFHICPEAKTRGLDPIPADGMPGGAKRVMKCFPVIDEWDGEVCFAVVDETVTKDILEEFLEVAGLHRDRLVSARESRHLGTVQARFAE